MSAENPVEHSDQEEKSGIRAWIRGTRLAQILHRWNSGRYEEYVPKDIREYAEKEGIPKPIRYIP